MSTHKYTMVYTCQWMNVYIHVYVQTYQGMIHTNLTSVCVCVRVGWGVVGMQNQPTKNTETSSPQPCLKLSLQPFPTQVCTQMCAHVCDASLWQWTATGPVLMRPRLAQTTARNRCHSVMTDSGDTFRPRSLSLKAPAAHSHPQPSAWSWRGPGLELCFHLLHRQGMFPSTQTELKESSGLAHRDNTALVYLTN